MPNNFSEIKQKIGGQNHSAARWLEDKLTLSEVLELRSNIAINENGEPLMAIPTDLCQFASPHPYQSAGAPYDTASPFFLRAAVVQRLIVAQRYLAERAAGHHLYIFDGYRPKSVQVYMRTYEHQRFARELGFSPPQLTPEQDIQAWAKVDALWAKPSSDPNLPTPHSTGAAIDLTIVDSTANYLEMGSEFDESSARILPNYYATKSDTQSVAISRNRELLRSVMEDAGFRRLTHEWWHFSYGDQVWALLESLQHDRELVASYAEASII